MLIAIAIVVLGIPAILIDWWIHRIPNRLVIATLLAGLLIHVSTGGLAGLWSVLLGAVIGLAILLPFNLLGAMGAGDVKFMGAMGGLVGSGAVLLAGELTLVAGGLLAMGAFGWRSLFGLPDVQQPADGQRAAPSVAMQMPYAAAIVAGALMATLLDSHVAWA
jgi:prepilin peptidase CpaA